MKRPQKIIQPAQENYLEITFDDFTLKGKGIAGVETVYTLPQFNLTLDTGRAPQFAVHQPYLALTHFHMDHAGGLAFFIGLRCLNDLPPLKILVPPGKVEAALEYLASLKKISESNLQYEVISNQEPIQIKNNLRLEALPAYHCTEANGYLVHRCKSKLKQKYQGLDSHQIIQLKQKGEVVEEEVWEKLFAFSGDTRAEFFQTDAAKAKVLLMECSFFSEDGDYEKIRKYGHTHINDWVEWADRIQSETVIMTHTSQRYSELEIEAACKKKLPRDLWERLVLFR